MMDCSTPFRKFIARRVVELSSDFPAGMLEILLHRLEAVPESWPAIMAAATDYREEFALALERQENGTADEAAARLDAICRAHKAQ